MTAVIHAPPSSAQTTSRWVWHNLRGAVTARVLTVRLRYRPELAAAAGSPRWAVTGSRVATALCTRRATTAVCVTAVGGGISAYVGTTVIAVALLGLTVAWVVFRRWWALYARSARGRVRAYGCDAFGVPVLSYADRDGFAGFWELRRNLSADAARTVAVIVRPSLAVALPTVPDKSAGAGAVAEAKARQMLAVGRIPPTECGTLLGPSVIGPIRATDCYASHRDVIGIYGPPQTGKGAWYGGRIIDHCGAVVATSTKLDLYLATGLLRETGGRRVWLFNPDGLGGIDSTLRWDPLDGCADANIARTRAQHLVGGYLPTGGKGGGGDDLPWDGWAIGVLAALLMTAARSGKSMAVVAHWVFTQEEGAKLAERLLFEAFEGRPPQLVVDAMRQIVKTEAKRTRDSIFMILRDAVAFMADDAIAATCTPRAGERGLDVAAFIANGDTLHVIAKKGSVAAPLRAALLGHLFETAKALSAAYPRERLDPPLAMALDEVALNPVPLPEWLPDAGGRGIHIWWAVQSPSQLDSVWGTYEAKVIRDCTNVLMVYGGLKDADDLRHLSEMCDHRHEMTPDPDGDGPGHARYERVPVITPDGIRRLVELHPLVIQRNSRPTIVRVDPYWERDDVKAAGPADKGAVTTTSERVNDDQHAAEVVPFPALERAS